ncbi:MAG TPA: hypothetical protein VK636_06755, partial [Gemmatimonadaceae bacterium]|nr:hypothetical protein [Gemmatimonadaceae bacterium]
MADEPTPKPTPKKRASTKERAHVAADLSHLPPPINHADLERLISGGHSAPHSILGAHPAEVNGESGVIIRALVPNATAVECRIDDGR